VVLCVCERESRVKGEREREEERKREREGAREMNHLRDNIISFALHKLKIFFFNCTKNHLHLSRLSIAFNFDGNEIIWRSFPKTLSVTK